MADELNPIQAKKRNSNLNLFVKITSVSIFVIGLIAVLVFGRREEFPTGTVIVLLIVFGLIVLSLFYGSQILSSMSRKEDSDGKQPKAISDEDCFNIVKEAMVHPMYADSIGRVFESGSELIGELNKEKSWIYCLYFKGKKGGNSYAYIINKHFPDQHRRVLVNPSRNQIKMAKNGMASNPLSQPDVEETVREDPLTGVKSTTKKTTHKVGDKNNNQGELK